ncbi:MAG: peptide deformylase [Thermoleophilaceae bacterium]|nr:peptide deformylase [Thermoleophilaceae bacterium]
MRFPHPALKREAGAVAESELGAAREIAQALSATMRSFPGCVGIAANQIGELTRVIVVDISVNPKATTKSGLLQLVNPVIVASEGSEVAREGCLSIPDYTANVRRATSIAVQALSPGGEPLRIETDGFEARCLIHEIDHLDGLLFLDRVDSLTSDVFRRKKRAD